MVKVNLLGIFRQYAPSVDEEGCFAVEHQPGMTAAEALGRTNISETTVKYSILVNNMRKKADYVLEDGDVVKVMPLISGG